MLHTVFVAITNHQSASGAQHARDGNRALTGGGTTSHSKPHASSKWLPLPVTPPQEKVAGLNPQLSRQSHLHIGSTVQPSCSRSHLDLQLTNQDASRIVARATDCGALISRFASTGHLHTCRPTQDRWNALQLALERRLHQRTNTESPVLRKPWFQSHKSMRFDAANAWTIRLVRPLMSPYP